jgi:hypothetical protein
VNYPSSRQKGGFLEHALDSNRFDPSLPLTRSQNAIKTAICA